MNKELIEEITNEIKGSAKDKLQPKTESKIYISSSSTLLNLACSNRADGAFQLGKIFNIIGDSSSGKSFLALSTLAMCANDKGLDDHLLIYDDVEAACSFDIRKLFGRKANRRIDKDISSNRIEDFFHRINTLLKEEKKFIYILDSFDALTTDKEIEKTESTLEAVVNGKSVAGDYGMQKAKISSQMLRMVCGKIKDTESLLIIISQTRDNINPMSFAKVTRAGGRALKFYSSIEMWLSVVGEETKTVDGEKYPTGVKTKIKIKKQKQTGAKSLYTPMTMYYYYGIDNIGDCIDYLIKHKVFIQTKLTIKTEDLKFEGTSKRLIKHIEQNNLEDKLTELVGEKYREIGKLIIGEPRKPRFKDTNK